MARNRNDYFKMAEEQVALCAEASDLLTGILSNYSINEISRQREKMHEIENRADELQHDILTKLSREFITPIDQEDILHLVQIIDDVADALDEVVLELYMFHIETIPEAAPELSKMVGKCVKALQNAIGELKNFKKPERLRTLLVEVNTIESEADVIYVEAIHKLFGSETNGKALLGGKQIYESLENCCDLCERAADVVEQIIIKNT